MIEITPIYSKNIKVNQTRVPRHLKEIINFVVIKSVGSIFKIKNEITVNVQSVSDNVIQKMNLKYRNKDKVTNILTFPCDNPNQEDFEDLPVELGDIYVCLSKVEQEASEQGISPVDHLAHLIVHSCLHLAGYDHEDDSGFEAMKQREKNILLKMGIKDPYM